MSSICVSQANVYQEMGLGKTLSALALVCHHLDQLTDNVPADRAANIPRATIIICPNSSGYPHLMQYERIMKTEKFASNLWMAKPA